MQKFNQPKRKRSPWFAFYPDDFDSGTRAMTLAGRGAYLSLLCYQFSNGTIPKDERTICRIIGAFPDEWAEIRSEVLAKFEALEDGSWINRRMEKEREERDGIRVKRIEAVQKRWGNGFKPDTNEDTSVSTKPGANGDTSPSPSPSPSLTSYSHSGNGGGGAKKEHRRPTLTEAKAAAGNAGATPEEAETWWHKREAADWMRSLGGNAQGPVGSNWQSDLKQWAGGERQRKADAENRPRFNGAKPAAEPVDHSKGFFTEGQPSKRNQNGPQSHQNAPQSLASVAEGRDSGHGKTWL